MQKNYIGISRDHSASMRGMENAAANDYNETTQSIKEESIEAGLDTIVSVVKCGVGYEGKIIRESINSSIAVLKKIEPGHYIADGHATPLFDSVLDLISQFEKVPDADDKSTSFLVMAITDGQDNNSEYGAATKLAKKIKQLQGTDRWTFVFRVPVGYGKPLQRTLGLHEGNILEWDTSDKGMRKSTEDTRAAFKTYYTEMKTGVKATSKFYTNLKDVTPAEIKASLVDISSQVNLWKVEQKSVIKPFIEGKLKGRTMAKGGAFYQLTKTEPEVQDYKQVIIRDKVTGVVYSGANARDMLGLPRFGMARVAPGDHGQYDIYLQSTSINRALPAGTTVMYWPLAGVNK